MSAAATLDVREGSTVLPGNVIQLPSASTGQRHPSRISRTMRPHALHNRAGCWSRLRNNCAQRQAGGRETYGAGIFPPGIERYAGLVAPAGDGQHALGLFPAELNRFGAGFA